MGNLEKILVGIIIVTIVAILGLAIWGLGGHDTTKHPGTISPPAVTTPEKEPIPETVSPSTTPAVTEIPSSPAPSTEVSKIANGFGDLVKQTSGTAPGTSSTSGGTTTATDNPSASATPAVKRIDPYPTLAEQAHKYGVKKGDTYQKIARSVLGDAGRWHEIYDLNRDIPPSKLHPGMTLVVPAKADLAAGTSPPTKSAPPTPRETPKETVASSANAASASDGTHTVKKGETLYGIAREYLHDGSKWKLIAAANPDKIRGSSEIVAGTTLRIPRR
ncbi:MAG: LysM peptidoglycan-binding domain-containing protein [Planctomycetes bacterium]|nr:LysM peptidoglycan-binding domain-containing protein [Planctomycetota bacterium]MBI3847506.1 LysM peptidoglycan-binding domain-containing protein [Planctomycetota bacterium]